MRALTPSILLASLSSARNSELPQQRGCGKAGCAAELQLTLVDDDLLGSLDVIRSVQMREWNILLHSSSCFALSLIPRYLEDEKTYGILLLVSVVPFSGKYDALSGKYVGNGEKTENLAQLCP